MASALLPLAWYWPALGGLAIGTAAGVLLLTAGRVMGVSGMLGIALGLSKGGDRKGALLFLIGAIVAAGVTYALVPGHTVSMTPRGPALLLGGLLVGYGTRLGSGCTSGHGVCGLARLSPRSIAATAVFMTAAALTVFAMRHLWGMP
ncbi:YeeE/YedE family protein [Luteibacter sahnii]|uniref:YeeE/YedE family protein n=1 Tax=Luteibacter sahnii TaxID=3021977 RepID=UPI002A6A4959|nr:YeeE/YedE thiosulfate transporter family protein [Luteibacter sp. PPL193]MDY1547065.1 YeeE/YedE thiosulfate transporter family protein [Luteibacter sp. PPL193]